MRIEGGHFVQQVASTHCGLIKHASLYKILRQLESIQDDPMYPEA